MESINQPPHPEVDTRRMLKLSNHGSGCRTLALALELIKSRAWPKYTRPPFSSTQCVRIRQYTMSEQPG